MKTWNVKWEKEKSKRKTVKASHKESRKMSITEKTTEGGGNENMWLKVCLTGTSLKKVMERWNPSILPTCHFIQSFLYFSHIFIPHFIPPSSPSLHQARSPFIKVSRGQADSTLICFAKKSRASVQIDTHTHTHKGDPSLRKAFVQVAHKSLHGCRLNSPAGIQASEWTLKNWNVSHFVH